MNHKGVVFCVRCARIICQFFEGRLCDREAEKHMQYHWDKDRVEAKVIIGHYADLKKGG